LFQDPLQFLSTNSLLSVGVTGIIRTLFQTQQPITARHFLSTSIIRNCWTTRG